MKILSLFLVLVTCVFSTGCTQMAMGPVPDPNRVVTGTLSFTEPATLPAGAQITIRVLDTSRVDGLAKIITEENFKSEGASPIPFKIEFHAEDATLQRGLSIEARITYDKKVQLFNANSYVITLANLGSTHDISLERMSR